MNVENEASADPAAAVRTMHRSFVPGLVIVVLGIALVVLVWRGGNSDDRPDSLTIVPSRATASLWEQHTITSGRSEPAHSMTVVDGEYRVTSKAANTDGNQRELWSLDHDYSDVDVTVRIDRPSSLGGAFKPQPGIALRYHDDGHGAGRALIIDGNIWSRNYDRMIVGVWKWAGPHTTKVDIDQIGQPLVLRERKAIIVGATRAAGDPATDVFAVDPAFDPGGPYGFRPGDRVDIATAVDDSYTRTGAVVSTVDQNGGLIWVRHPGTTAKVPFAAEVGTVKFHYTDAGVDPRAFYPRYVRARIVGSTIQVKSWLVEQPEPGWQFSEAIPADFDVPDSGRVGLVANHLYGEGRFIAFGDVTIRPVTTP